MGNIKSFLWFDNNAEEAVDFYRSLFRNVTIGKIARYSDAGPAPKGQVMTIEFEIEGQSFVALNGGPHYQFTPAVSFSVECETQAEIDRLWDGLVAGGGKPVQCGWITDRFGLSWQIVPKEMSELMSGPKAGVVARAMFQMVKLDIAKLKEAAEAA